MLKTCIGLYVALNLSNELKTLKHKIMITYPASIKSTHYCFKVNTDDFFDPKPISDFLKGKGIDYEKSKQYSTTKCMGWHVYKIKAKKPIGSFQENIEFVENIFEDFNR